MLSILLRIFGDAQHSCSANGTHIAGLISEVPAKIFSELPRHGRLASPWNIPADIGCVLGPDLAAKTSEHLSRGFQKLPSVFASVFCTMNYTVLGCQIPHLSKETHKKTSMTVHLTLKCECSVGKTTPCKHETSYGVQYKSTTCIHSRVKVDQEPHSDLAERGREAPNPKKSRLPVHFSLNCECCTLLR